MSELNLDQVKQIFLEVRREPEPERERLIDELCGEGRATFLPHGWGLPA